MTHPLDYAPTHAEFVGARSTPRAYVLVDSRGLRWIPRPVTTPPRPGPTDVRSGEAWRMLLRAQSLLEPEPPTVRRFSSHVVAERMIAEARRG